MPEVVHTFMHISVCPQRYRSGDINSRSTRHDGIARIIAIHVSPPMSSPSSPVSTRLKRAAVAERAQLAKRRERIEQERVGVRTELERLERELADIDEHLEL